MPLFGELFFTSLPILFILHLQRPCAILHPWADREILSATGPHMENPPLILLFVKAPLPGQVKTRLAASLGEDATLQLYRRFAQDILTAIDGAGIAVQVHYTPADARKAVAAWLGQERQYAPQEGADLGSRMENAFRRAFAEGSPRAVLIGSDLPDLPGDLLTEAFRSLDNNDAVIGPAKDGGYYLIGFRRDTFLPAIFPGMAWGTNRVYSVTLERFTQARYRVHSLREWQDVDTVEDLKTLRARARGTAFEHSRTIAMLDRLCGTM